MFPKMISALILVLGFQQAIAGPTLDIAKFKKKGSAVCRQILDLSNISREGTVIFRDGAGSTDLPPVFDFGAFYYLVEAKPGVLRNDRVMAYRLKLNGSEDVVLLSSTDKDGSFSVVIPEGLTVLLKDDILRADVERLMADIAKVAPQSQVTYLDSIGVLLIEMPVLQSVSLDKLLLSSPVVQAIDESFENYRIPFEFDGAITVKEQGKIDADRYRGVVKRIKDEGIEFVTETTVPEDLQ